MMAAQRKRRPDVGAPGPADQGYTRETGQYSQAKEKASSAKGRLTALKFRWMMQVASDHMLPPASTPIAVFMAAKFLHPETLEAWPSIPTLARLIGRSVTQTRTGLQALVKRGHLDAEITRGGKGNTSRYRPVILVPKPFGKPQGIDPTNPAENDPTNPAENDRQTLRKMKAKPCGNPQGNPCNDPFDDSRRAQSAPADADHQYKDSPPVGSDADRTASGHDPAGKFKIGDEVELSIDGKELSRPITNIGTDATGSAFIMVTAEYGFGDANWIVPVDRTGRLQNKNGWWEPYAKEGATPIVRWGGGIGNPAPTARRKRHAAA